MIDQALKKFHKKGPSPKIFCLWIGRTIDWDILTHFDPFTIELR